MLTYWSGIVDENDLCYLGGMPGEMMDLVGLRSEEIDALYDGEYNGVVMEKENALGMSGSYTSSELMDRIKVSTAEVLGRYQTDFYAGEPCLTVNTYGKGKVYYIASKNDMAFLRDFYRVLRMQTGVANEFEGCLPYGVAAGVREDEENRYVVFQNYGDQAIVKLTKSYKDLQTDACIGGTLMLGKNQIAVLYRRK